MLSKLFRLEDGSHRFVINKCSDVLHLIISFSHFLLYLPRSYFPSAHLFFVLVQLLFALFVSVYV